MGIRQSLKRFILSVNKAIPTILARRLPLNLDIHMTPTPIRRNLCYLSYVTWKLSS